jgi:hypothetical protein
MWECGKVRTWEWRKVVGAGVLGDVAPAVAAPTLVGVETQTRPRFWGGEFRV